MHKKRYTGNVSIKRNARHNTGSNNTILFYAFCFVGAIVYYSIFGFPLNIAGANGHEIKLEHNKNAHDPTYQELENFLYNDTTDRHEYIKSAYTCGDFAETLQHNAERAGIKAGFVYINFVDDNETHACNVFNTTDRGLIFIDDTNNIGNTGGDRRDCIVSVEENKPYVPVYLFDSNYDYVSMGIVKNYQIYW